MKKSKLILTLTLIAVMICTFMGAISCKGNNGRNGAITVTFDKCYTVNESDNSTYSIEWNSGERSSLAGTGVVCTREGYEFLGYYDSREAGVQMFNSNGEQLYDITSNVTLYAQWKARVYSKTYIGVYGANVSTLAPLEVEVGDTVTELAMPTLEEGYELVGWAIDYGNSSTIISDGIFVKGEYAKVSVENSSIWFNSNPLKALVQKRKYLVTLDYNNGTGKTDEIKVTHGEALTGVPTLADDEDKKIEFVGWSTERYNYADYKNLPEYSAVKANSTLYAYWDQYKYVRFHKDTSGENYENVKVYRNKAFTMPNVEMPGYDNLGWYRNALCTGGAITTLNYNDGITDLYGDWKLASYKITYDLQGGMTENGETAIASVNYTIESEKELPTVKKEKYSFLGWYKSGDPEKKIISRIVPGMYGNLNLVAKFKGDDIRVTLETNQGYIYSKTATIEYGAQFKLNTPTLEGYAFSGWYLDEDFNQKMTDGYGYSVLAWDKYVKEGVTLYAKYDKMYKLTMSSSIVLDNAYTFSYSKANVISGGEDYAYYIAGDEVQVKITASGKYLFEGLYSGKDKVLTDNGVYSFTMPEHDVTLKVAFTVKTFMVILDANGGACSSKTAIVNAEEMYTLPIAHKQGYKFFGWEIPDYDIITNSQGVSKNYYDFNENITVVAFYQLDDTITDVYVDTAVELYNIRKDPTKTYQIIANINMSGYDWTPFDFTGKLYGNGFVVSNLTIRTDGDAGIFKNLSGTVDGLKLENIKVESNNYSEVRVAGICCTLEADGFINNCYISSGTIISDYGYIGGMVAVMNGGVVQNCINSARIQTDSAGSATVTCAGGIVGHIKKGTVSDCRNTGMILGSSRVGGIIGYTSDRSTAEFTRLYNSGQITGSGERVGGIVGYYYVDAINKSKSLTTFENIGSVTGQHYVGGIIGYMYNYINAAGKHNMTISEFSNMGTIVAEGNYAGGVFGYMKCENGQSELQVRLHKIENYGEVTGRYYVGGIFGEGYADSVSSDVSLMNEGVSYASITAEAYVGAIAGKLSNISLMNPSNAGSTIRATGAYNDGTNNFAYFGGYVGYAISVNITNAVNNVNLDYSSAVSIGNYVGGIAGYTSGTLNNCINNGNIIAPNSNYVGGIAGLFQKGGTISNATLSNNGRIKGRGYTAGIIGYVYSSVQGNSIYTISFNKLTNTGEVIATENYVGGLIGRVEVANTYSSKDQVLVIKDAINSANVTGQYYVGGLVGWFETDSTSSNIIDGRSRAVVTAKSDVGGLVGVIKYGNLISASNQNSTVRATESRLSGSVKYAYVGGLVGYAENASVNGSSNSIDIEYSAIICEGDYVGGIAGYISGEVKNCTNTGNVNAPNSNYVGGIAGQIKCSGNITSTDVENTGEIKGKSYVGGVAGYVSNESNSSTTYTMGLTRYNNSGEVVATGDYVGGIIGYSYSNNSNSTGLIVIIVKESSNLGNVKGQYYVGGLIGKISAESNSSTIIEGTVSGNVEGKAYVGGIVGWSIKVGLASPSVSSATITATDSYASGSNKFAYLGGFAGIIENANIINAVNNVNLNYSTTLCVGSYVGGIAGWSSGAFTSCENNGTIYAPNSDYVGGIAGAIIYNGGEVKFSNLINNANVTGGNYTAGIAGKIQNTWHYGSSNAGGTRAFTLTSITNNGNVVGKDYTAGLTGYLYARGSNYYSDEASELGNDPTDGTYVAVTVTLSSNTGDITGDLHVGGLIGEFYTDTEISKAIEVSSSGKVKAKAYAGALVGNSFNVIYVSPSNDGATLTVTEYLAKGEKKKAYIGGYFGYITGGAVSGAVNKVAIDYSGTLCVGDCVGGIAGAAETKFDNCFNEMDVYAPNSQDVGGIAGYSEYKLTETMSTLTNSGDITGLHSVGGIFGIAYNVYYNQSYNTTTPRVLNYVDFTNSGAIVGNNKVGGLIGYIYMRGSNYNSDAESEFNKDTTEGNYYILYVTNAVNSGAVTGQSAVAGIFGHVYTDTANSTLYSYTQTGVVSGGQVVGTSENFTIQ